MLLGKNEKHIEKGTLILKYDEIEIILDDRKLIIDPSKFQFTSIHYSGYAGKNVFINTRKYSGTDNRIIYYELSKKYNFKFLVRSEFEEQQIFRIYEYWESRGYYVNNFRIQ